MCAAHAVCCHPRALHLYLAGDREQQCKARPGRAHKAPSSTAAGRRASCQCWRSRCSPATSQTAAASSCAASPAPAVLLSLMHCLPSKQLQRCNTQTIMWQLSFRSPAVCSGPAVERSACCAAGVALALSSPSRQQHTPPSKDTGPAMPPVTALLPASRPKKRRADGGRAAAEPDCVTYCPCIYCVC